MIIHKHFNKDNNDYNWYMGCSFCGQAFAEREDFVRVDRDVSWFRGDDEVRCYHQGCLRRARQDNHGDWTKIWALPDKTKTPEEIKAIRPKSAFELKQEQRNARRKAEKEAREKANLPQ